MSSPCSKLGKKPQDEVNLLVCLLHIPEWLNGAKEKIKQMSRWNRHHPRLPAPTVCSAGSSRPSVSLLSLPVAPSSGSHHPIWPVAPTAAFCKELSLDLLPSTCNVVSTRGHCTCPSRRYFQYACLLPNPRAGSHSFSCLSAAFDRAETHSLKY